MHGRSYISKVEKQYIFINGLHDRFQKNLEQLSMRSVFHAKKAFIVALDTKDLPILMKNSTMDLGRPFQSRPENM